MWSFKTRNFSNLHYQLKTTLMYKSEEVHTERWQGVDISKKPEMVSYELLNVVASVPLPTEDLDWFKQDIKPNLPWADDHFLERVSGEPLNPGIQWANWPWAKSADKFREGEMKIFNHTYMERLWPKYARRTKEGKMAADKAGLTHLPTDSLMEPHRGISWWYGDLEELVALLVSEPHTRQAYIPLFFPEDTGYADGGRKPCTLGYQFIMRNDRLHIYYPIRSCDFIRHFRDDCYLAIRLLLWVLDRCRERNSQWATVTPGTYTMHMTSLHIFKNDWQTLFGKPR